MMATPATLDGSTLWRLYFSLVYTSEDGTKNLGAQETVVTGRFVEDEGYEPPQGYFVVDEDAAGLMQPAARHRWTLSEDPEDRKDGLWIWGLFSEPLYPFLLLELASSEFAFPSGFTLPEGAIYIQADHSRDDSTKASVLPGISKGTGESVKLANARVSFRQVKTYNADLAGISKVNVKEDLPLGSVRFSCVSETADSDASDDAVSPPPSSS